MKTLTRYTLSVIFLIAVFLCFVPASSYAQPPAPTGLTAVNIGGPIQLSWTASVGATQYMLYRSTATITDLASDIVEVAGISTSTSFIDINTEDSTTYRYVATAWNSLGEESVTFSNVAVATAFYAMLEVTLVATDSIIDFESNGTPASTTISWTVNNGYLAESIELDIIDNYSKESIFDEPPITVQGGSFTWDGSWPKEDEYTKHNGSYTVQVTPIGFDGERGATAKLTITVHVVHINYIIQTFTDYGQTTIAHSLPIHFSYQLTKDAWTTITIYNTNGTDIITDDTLIKRFTYQSPRNDEGKERNFREYQTWDGTDDTPNHKLVPSGIYRFTIDAYFDHGYTTPEDSVDIADTRGWFFALDKRIVDITTEAITETKPLAKIKYTLTEPANVKIKICKSGTTFTTNPTTGEAIPYPTTNLVKTFTFYQQSAGEQEVTWDGNNEDKTPMDKGLYLVVITATDVEENWFFNTTGTDNLFRSTVVIDKTASQLATDSTPPTLVSTFPSDGSTIISSFSQVSATLQDEAGGSGLDLENSTITLTYPNGTVITDTKSKSDDGFTLLLTFSAQSTNGTYTIRVIPQDNAGNTGSDYRATFTLSLTTAGEQAPFKETVYVYPNPVNTGKATFAYNLVSNAVVTIKIYNMMGELVYSDRKNDTSGVKTWDWNCVNESGNFVGSGLYIYTLTAHDGTSAFEAVKKLVIIR